MTDKARVNVALVISAIVLLFAGGYWWSRSGYEALFQRHFHLPDDIALSDVLIRRNSRPDRPHVEAIATFSPARLQEYIASLYSAHLWRPTLTSYGGHPVTSYSEQALKWSSSSLPAVVGNRRVRLGLISSKYRGSVRKPRALCFGFQGLDKTGHQAPIRQDADHYVAKGCSEFARTEHVRGYVVGLLDVENGKLYMVMHR
ncbi:MAG: hypothetical protein KDJ29_16165 [Hyphomicrobiales bacterium]|nr:hypothetical protein [Hyphomicrobiales bacterium]